VYWGALTFSSELPLRAENLFLAGIDPTFSTYEGKKNCFFVKKDIFLYKKLKI